MGEGATHTREGGLLLLIVGIDDCKGSHEGSETSSSAKERQALGVKYGETGFVRARPLIQKRMFVHALETEG